MNASVPHLIQRHRSSGIVVDTNLLLLYLIGRFDQTAITTFKRTNKYAPEDFALLFRLLGSFRRVLTTPHVLTEVTDLAETFNRQRGFGFFRRLQSEIRAFAEHCLASKDVSSTHCFLEFGLADATLKELARQDRLILTDELPLYLHLARERLPVINFTHLRTIGV